MSSVTDSSEVNSVSSEEVNVAQEDEQLPPRPGISIYIYIMLYIWESKLNMHLKIFLRNVINK